MKKEKVTWQMEHEALTNALKSYSLDNYRIHENYKRKVTFYLVDENYKSLTGCWSYEQLNHFILGYGKAMEKIKANTPETESTMHPIFAEALKPFGIK